MEYIKGQKIKPLSISRNGIVTFSDNKQATQPSQEQCLAYGYKYDKATGTCYAFNFHPALNFNLQNINNYTRGGKNTIRTGSNNTMIVGEKNLVNGFSRNNIIVGQENQIKNTVNNTFVYGTLGDSTTDNTIVLGGNKTGDILGERQTKTFLYGARTNDGTQTNANLNNTTGSFFQPHANSVYLFEIQTLAVRVGSEGEEPPAGNVGDFKSFIERGVCKNARTGLTTQSTVTALESSGTTTGWATETTVLDDDFKPTVTGAEGMDIEWVQTIKLTEIRTSVTL